MSGGVGSFISCVGARLLDCIHVSLRGCLLIIVVADVVVLMVGCLHDGLVECFVN